MHSVEGKYHGSPQEASIGRITVSSCDQQAR